MKIWDLIKCGIMGSILSGIALTGIGSFPGDYLEDYLLEEKLEGEFKRKGKALSKATLRAFESAVSAHREARKTKTRADWRRTLKLYYGLKKGRTTRGKKVNLLRKSYVVAGCLSEALQTIGKEKLASRYRKQRNRLLEKSK